MSTLSDSLLKAFMTGELWKKPELKWVKVIRCMEVKEIEISELLDAAFHWIEIDPPVKWVVEETIYCVVADYGEGPQGYFFSSDPKQAETIAQAMREDRVQDFITLS